MTFILGELGKHLGMHIVRSEDDVFGGTPRKLSIIISIAVEKTLLGGASFQTTVRDF